MSERRRNVQALTALLRQAREEAIIAIDADLIEFLAARGVLAVDSLATADVIAVIRAPHPDAARAALRRLATGEAPNE